MTTRCVVFDDLFDESVAQFADHEIRLELLILEHLLQCHCLHNQGNCQCKTNTPTWQLVVCLLFVCLLFVCLVCLFVCLLLVCLFWLYIYLFVVCLFVLFVCLAVVSLTWTSVSECLSNGTFSMMNKRSSNPCSMHTFCRGPMALSATTHPQIVRYLTHKSVSFKNRYQCYCNRENDLNGVGFVYRRLSVGLDSVGARRCLARRRLSLGEWP